MKNNEDINLCKACVNCCCQNIPGIYDPLDNPPDIAFIAEKLKAGEWSIDWWEPTKDEPQMYYLRPATQNSKCVFDPSWGGKCVYLADTGCKLEFDKRPSQCQALNPSKDRCTLPDKYTKKEIAIRWKPYTDILLRAGKLAQ